ncbi:MAG: flagellar assembly protein FliH [Azonexus sp.]|jgi:flagellar assembly protein FliH|uniref:flagellar assembly protein FliH n=1 Tax=Azonexus sp. TaxID=1872668 RepID=UPI00281C1115|nr:flagellar assembly protein FliH [Azonexus sp.]MDR0777726.1 flagellar assembly protein FliH [Azonexus sp.]
MTISRKEPASFRRWEADSFDRKKPEPPTTAPPPPSTEPPPAAAQVPPPEPEPSIRLPSTEEIERLRAEARAAGYAAGLAEGRAAAAEESRQNAVEATQQFGELTGNLKRSLEQLDQTVAEQLLALAVEIAAQVTRGQIAVREDVLLPVVREAIAALPLSHGEMTLRLNPADATNLYQELTDALSQSSVQIVEDESISIGGCLLQAGTSEIDARIETRWKRVLETIGAAPRAWQNP